MKRLTPARWLAHLDEARRVARAGKSPEGVHQVRVSARRLRVWLTLGGHRVLHDDLRWLCRELSLQRDLDVFGEVLEPAVLGALRDEAHARVQRALGSPRWQALRSALGQIEAPPRREAKRALRRLERRLAERRGATLGDGAAPSPEVLHAFRRALRRVRYAREWLALDASALAADQEALGAVCDLFALERFCREHGGVVPGVLARGVAAARDEWVSRYEAAQARSRSPRPGR